MIARRSFLLGLGATLAAPAIVRAESIMPIWMPKRPILWGDGSHDDAPALRALFQGEPFKDRSPTGVFTRTHEGWALRNGYFRIKSSIGMPRDGSRYVAIERNYFDGRFTVFEGIDRTLAYNGIIVFLDAG